MNHKTPSYEAVVSIYMPQWIRPWYTVNRACYDCCVLWQTTLRSLVHTLPLSVELSIGKAVACGQFASKYNLLASQVFQSSCGIKTCGFPAPLTAAERGPISAILVALLSMSAIPFHQYVWISEKHAQSSWNWSVFAISIFDTVWSTS